MPASGRPPLAALFGCRGHTLSEAERAFFAETDPLGFILFTRNVENADQVRRLVAELRDVVGRADAPVLIDQEGGRVQRLGPPEWRQAPAAAAFAALYAHHPADGLEAARLNAHLIADDLADLGIDVNCAPVLDVPQPDAHDIIGDRAYGTDPETIARLGRAVADGLLAGGVQPVAKHVPGHGRATADSHHDLPVVETAWQFLEAVDFAPFQALSDGGWAMTAHVVYTAVDPDRPATLSSAVIGAVVRGAIGFDGFLVSDDVSMKALGGSYEERTSRALDAGCDAVLHCNGEMDEMRAVAAAARPLDDAALARLAAARARMPRSGALDRWTAETRLAALLGAEG